MSCGPKLNALRHKLRENRSGTSAVEFALVAPVFIALLMGTVEIGHLFLVQAEMTATTREAVRRVATDVMPVSDTHAFIHNRLAEVIPHGSSTGSGGLTDSNESNTLNSSSSPESGASDPCTVSVTETELPSGRTDLTVDVSVPVSEATLLNLVDLFAGDMTLDVSATMVKE